MRSGLWIVAGAMMLFGVTAEIRRYFRIRSISSETANLASGLAVSAWWLVFAAALVVMGFRLSLKPARVAGLLVAGLAVLKVVLFDLSSLDALYRVGSVFILALVALSLAYLYYRSDRSAACGLRLPEISRCPPPAPDDRSPNRSRSWLSRRRLASGPTRMSTHTRPALQMWRSPRRRGRGARRTGESAGSAWSALSTAPA